MSGQKTINTTTAAVGAIKIQQSTYGLVLPIVWGRTRINGNLIWYGDFKATPHTVTTQSGGKGGGAPKQTETSYTYSASVAMALCEGPIFGIRTAWRGKKIFIGSSYSGTTVRGDQTFTYPSSGNTLTVAHTSGWVNVAVQIQVGSAFADDFKYRRGGTYMDLLEGVDYTCSAGVYTFVGGHVAPGQTILISYTYLSTNSGVSCLGQIGLDIKPGTPGQAPWSYLTTNHPTQALTYSSVAYITGANYPLGSDASVENHAFEIESSYMFSSSIPDANPAPVVLDALSNPQYGANFGAEKLWLTDYQSACTAQGIFLSPALTAQQSAASFLDAMATLTNVGLVWSGGVLKFVPYADTAMTANGVTFTPNTTPIYDLTDDDFQPMDDGPIRVDRGAVSDSFNSVSIEYSDRSNAYNVAVMQATDQADIQENGLRQMSTITAPWITEASIAKIIATLILQRSMFIRNKYQFKLGWTKIALEAMDIVTITDAALGLNKLPVRIISMEEDADGYIDISAEDFPKGSASATMYPSTTGIGFAPNFNEDPGAVLAPVIFEGPSALAGSSSGLEVWIAAGGTGANYGGCEIWVSLTGSNYQRAASLKGSTRYGTTTSALSAASAGATTETLGISLVAGGQLIAASSAEMVKLNTLCYVGGEFMAYEGATLTGAGAYTIGNHMQRGAYLSAPGAHASGAAFVRCDSGVAHLPLTADYIGQTLHVKLLPFNRYGGGMGDLASATEYTYSVTGLQANLAPSAPGNLAVEGAFTIDTAKFKWDKVPNAATYNVQMWAGSTLAKVREVNVGDALRFDYSASDARADGGPWRALTVKVQGINANGAVGPLATLAVTNAQVGALSGITLLAGVKAIAFGCARPTDADFFGIQVWISATSGFTPDATTLVYDGPNTAVTLTATQDGTALVSGTTYYVKCAAYDTFDKLGMTIVSAGSAAPIAPGLNNCMVYAYQRAASAPSGTPGDVTVTFASNSITAPGALANGWHFAIPSTNGNPLYVTAISGAGTGATVNLLSASWSAAAVLAMDGPGGTGTDGTNGLNSATIMIYQRSASATALTLPSASTTYTFATGVLSGLNNGWAQGVPAADVTKPYLQVSIATAVAAAATDTVAATEWSTAQVQSQDGVSTSILSDDPFILNATGAWDIASGISVGTGTTATGAVCSNYFDAPTYNGADRTVFSKRAFAIDPTRTYDLTANLYAASGNNRAMFIAVNFYDASGTAIASSAVTPNWGGAFSGYTYGDNAMAQGVFSRHGGHFGAGVSARPIPSNARLCKIGVWLQYTGSGSSSVEQAAQDLRLDDVTEAAAAASAAAQAQLDATAALTSLTAIFADNVLSRDEKPDVIQRWGAVGGEYGSIVAQAAALSVSHSAIDTAYSALSTYLSSLSPAWNDTTQNTTIVRTDADTAWNNYYAAKVALQLAIAAKSATTADWPNIAGQTNAPANNASADVVMVGRNCTVYGNTVKRTTGGGGWDADAYTIDGYTAGAYITARFVSMTSQYTMVGLCLNPAASSSYSNLAYGVFVADTGTAKNVYLYHNGTQISSYGNIGADGDIYGIYYDDVSITVERNGAVLEKITTGIASGQKFFGQTCIVTSGIAVDNVRFGPQVSVNFASIGGPTRPSDNASTDITLLTTNFTVAGNSATRTGTFGWTGAVWSNAGHTNGIQVSMISASVSSEFMFGISLNPSASASYTNVNWGIYANGSGSVYIFKDGSIYASLGTLGASGDVWSLTYDGVKVRAYHNGVLFYTTNPADSTAGLTYYPMLAVSTIGAVFTNIRCSAFAAADWATIGGPNRPADNATSNTVTAGTTAPTSPINGDIWIDTNAPVTIKSRVAGAWVVGGNVPTSLAHVNSSESTKLGGIATGATVNIVSTGVLSARPTGANGDFYFATDTSILYQKVSGAWVSGPTVGAPAGSYVGATLAQTVEARANAALPAAPGFTITTYLDDSQSAARNTAQGTACTASSSGGTAPVKIGWSFTRGSGLSTASFSTSIASGGGTATITCNSSLAGTLTIFTECRVVDASGLIRTNSGQCDYTWT